MKKINYEKTMLNQSPFLLGELDNEMNEDFDPLKLSIGSSRKVYWKCEKGHKWGATISSRIKGNNCPYCANKKVWYGFNDLRTNFPQIADGWDYKKNSKDISPENTYYNSTKEVWWKCRNGHEIFTSIRNRVKRGCIYCSETGDSKTLRNKYPEVAKYWDFAKNQNVNIDYVKPKSHREIFWKCDLGHEWNNRIANQVKCNSCPVCNNKSLLTGFNDLKTKFPLLSSEWDYDKNEMRPEEVLFCAEIKVWWKCKKGHSWYATINNRAIRNQGCPYCKRNLVIPGINDLETVFPSLAAEWDTKENGITAREVYSKSNGKYHWKCKQGHEWEQVLYERVMHNYRCPFCNEKRAIKGVNDLATLYPSIAQEWDYEENTRLDLYEMLPHSNAKVAWRCAKGHKWKTRISHRVQAHSACPYCVGRKAIIGENDLITIHPELLSEWDFEKNRIDPKTILPNCSKKVWWKCKRGHEWKVSPNRRMRGSNCPICAKN